jgi:hypothetical protein
MAKKKKTYYKKKFKGVRYVTKALGKYFKKRYPNYKDRSARARVIHSEIIANGEKVILANIFSKERHKRVSKVKDLFYPNALEDVIPFFSIEDYVDLIRQSDSKIRFESSIFSEDLPDVNGGEKPNYYKCFSSFVKYCNKLLSETSVGESDSTDIQWFVKTLPPVKKGDYYVMEIVTCNNEGEIDEDGFDFDPNDISTIGKFSNTFTGEKEKETTEVKEVEFTKQNKFSIREKELEIEKIEKETQLEFTKAFNNLSFQFKEGVITKSEFKEMLKKLR